MNDFSFISMERTDRIFEPAGIYFDIPKSPGLYGLKHPIADKVARACIWILSKLGALKPYRTTMPEVKTHHVTERDAGGLFDYVEQQLREAKAWPAKASTLLVGPETWRELVYGADIRQPYGFHFERPYMVGGSAYPVMFGLDVVIVPWMEGAIVLPEPIDYVYPNQRARR